MLRLLALALFSTVSPAVTLSSWSAILPPASSTVNVTVTPAAGWSASSNQPWLTITPAAQSVTLTATANPGPLARTATITIGDKLFFVTQASPSGAYSRWGKLTYGASIPIAGNGTYAFSGDGGPATAASLLGSSSLAVDTLGNVYVADGSLTPRVRKITAETGIISTVAGNGNHAYAGDGGLATAASFLTLSGVAVAPNGNIYLVDSENSRIRAVDAATGLISSLAGNGAFGYTGDGSASPFSTLYLPHSIATDQAGNIYFSDTLNQRVRRIDSLSGLLTTVAGNGGLGFSGDGGPATSAQLFNPAGVSLDAVGNLYIQDFGNQRTRKVNAATGIITTLLTSAPEITVDPAGNLFFASNGVQRLDAATGLLSTVSTATAANLAADGAGNLYYTANNRVYFLDLSTPSFSLSATSATVPAIGGSGALTLTVLPSTFTAWTISGAPSWLTVTSSLTGAISWTAAANPTTSQRTATLTIGDQLFTLTQPGKTPIGTQPPSLVSVTPSNPAATQTFTITARDPDGADNLYRIYFLIHPTPTIPTNTCHGFYDRALDAVFLYNDALTNLSSLTNSQCTINGFTAQSAGVNLTLSLTVTRKTQTPANLYLWITDNESNGTGWLSAASWTVAPALLSATPASSSSPTQTFTITAANVDRIYFLLHPSPVIPQNTCHGFYDRASNAVYLYNDSLTSLSSLANTQCSVDAFSTTFAGSTVTLNLTLAKRTVQPANFYLWLTNSTNNGAGWVPVATWSVAPVLLSASPATTSLPTQTFTITAANLDRIYFLLHPTPNIPQNTCHGFYDRAWNAVYLYNDALTSLSSPSNSQCAVVAFSATKAATTVTLSLTLAKKTTQPANLYLWISTYQGGGTGWLPVATWNFSNQQQPPVLVSVNPVTTPAASQTFTIVARDPDGAANLSRIYFLLNSTPTIPKNTCHGFYDRLLNAVYLYNDDLTGFPSLANSQCSVDAFTAAITSTTELTLNLTLTSKTYPLPKLYLWLTDNEANGTGWLLSSVMTTEPYLASITPSTTSAPTQQFNIVMRHPYGANSFDQIYFLIAPDTSTTLNQCFLTFVNTLGTITLSSDDRQNPNVPTNSQCTLNGYTIDKPPGDPTAVNITLALTRKTTTPATLFIGPYKVPTNNTRPPVPWIPAATWYP